MASLSRVVLFCVFFQLQLFSETLPPSYQKPPGIDCSQDTPAVRQAIRWGIEQMPLLAEIYPIGGAGDRLSLKDETTGQLLPAAQLKFCGRTLLEGLIRDVQGREYLYYKLFNEQLTTPIAAMTSHEKNNHQLIIENCASNQWFGRPKASFTFFIQPLVPMLTIEGNWAMKEPLRPFLKPGGHGVIWKTAADNGIFDWLLSLQRQKALVRQINNPIASTDGGLLALAGIGCQRNKSFGFASCERLLGASEGMDVLCERQLSDGFEYCITNIEYTDFEKHGIKDVPAQPGSAYSCFPANTNILFVDLKTIQAATQLCPIPGMIINMKNKEPCYAGNNQTVLKQAGRLESTMQNMADFLVDRFPTQLKEGFEIDLQTFITYNQRNKTISVTKQAFDPVKSIVGTPEGCFYDLMCNYADLLTNYCHMDVPPLNTKDDYLVQGPSFTTLFHPALGGLYAIIGQKIRGGRLSQGAEWIMEIAEADIENLDLDGSLLIYADAIMGSQDSEGVWRYDSAKCGKCTLKNVTVKNKGLAPHNAQSAWKRQVTRNGYLHIILRGNGEFFARDVVFEGNHQFEVPDGYRLEILQEGSKLTPQLEKIAKSTWEWQYEFDAEDRVKLTVKAKS